MKLAIIILSVGTLLVGCERVCACPPAIYQVRFTGSVISSTGPIADARVAARLSREQCPPPPAAGVPEGFEQDAPVNSAGHYELLAFASSSGPYCARLVARWATDSAVRDSIRVVTPGSNTVVVDFDVP